MRPGCSGQHDVVEATGETGYRRRNIGRRRRTYGLPTLSGATGMRNLR